MFRRNSLGAGQEKRKKEEEKKKGRGCLLISSCSEFFFWGLAKFATWLYPTLCALLRAYPGLLVEVAFFALAFRFRASASSGSSHGSSYIYERVEGFFASNGLSI